MFSYTLKRLGQTVLVLIGITLITFLLLNVVPGDPVAMMLDKRADEATIEKVRHEMGLDVPLHEQYIDFVEGAVKLDFGTSYFTKEVVIDAIVRCFKVTVCDVISVCSGAGCHVWYDCRGLPRQVDRFDVDDVICSRSISSVFLDCNHFADFNRIKIGSSANLWI
mgnify:CR=1 FL=1